MNSSQAKTYEDFIRFALDDCFDNVQEWQGELVWVTSKANLLIRKMHVLEGILKKNSEKDHRVPLGALKTPQISSGSIFSDLPDALYPDYCRCKNCG